MSGTEPGRLLFDFVRHWSRRPPPGSGWDPEQGRLVLVTEVVAAIVGRGEHATVNAIAYGVGIDQSGASRLVRRAADLGYLVLATNPSDARSREAHVTTKGHQILRQAHAWQERVFADLTADWTKRRRREFEAAMTDLVARSHELG